MDDAGKETCKHERFDDYREAARPDAKGVYCDAMRCAKCGEWVTHLTKQRPGHFHFYCLTDQAPAARTLELIGALADSLDKQKEQAHG